MPALLELPVSLSHLPYFILRYYRDSGQYELVEPNKTNTYNIGDAFATRAYFTRIGLEYLGGRAMDAALAFGASQASIKGNRAWGLDMCKVNENFGLNPKLTQDPHDRDRMPDDDDEIAFVSGLPNLLKK